ncbi:hypothetical protein BC826DRAFT_1114318 [Russula brevipes]|nr:hypothetical protein BC826DRAFT_1114318 [Russula brevipes]
MSLCMRFCTHPPHCLATLTTRQPTPSSPPHCIHATSLTTDRASLSTRHSFLPPRFRGKGNVAPLKAFMPEVLCLSTSLPRCRSDLPIYQAWLLPHVSTLSTSLPHHLDNSQWPTPYSLPHRMRATSLAADWISLSTKQGVLPHISTPSTSLPRHLNNPQWPTPYSLPHCVRPTFLTTHQENVKMLNPS